MNSSGTPAIRAARRDEVPRLASVLADAFDQYPWTRWSIPADGYRRRLTRLQELYVSYALDVGRVLTDEGLGGVIALLPPDAPSPSHEDQRRVVELHGERYADLVSAGLPAAPDGHWTIETLGVQPERQDRGLGRDLVRAGLSHVWASGGRGVALETSAERNVRLYTREGFHVGATTAVEGGPVVYSMVCAPTEQTTTARPGRAG